MARRAARAMAGGPEPAPLPPPPMAVEPVAEFAEIELAPPAETDADRLTFGQQAEPPRRGRVLLVVGLVLLFLAGAIGAGGYVWTVVSNPMTLPTRPPRPPLERGEPPIVMPLPTDEELRAAFRAQAAAQREALAPTPVPPPQD